MTVTLHVLRVFLGEDGESGGNPLGIVLDGASVPEDVRQPLASRLGFSETVFVDDRTTGRYRIFTPGSELPFAGHPTVGTAWLLADLGTPLPVIRPPAGEVPTWTEGELRWVRAHPSWVYRITLAELADPADVDAMREGPPDDDSYYPWAWLDRHRGVIRSRYFVRELGIEEDEATGGAAVFIADRLGRPLEIHQGREGRSRLYTRPGPDGTVELGGRVRLDEVRELELQPG